MFGDRMSKSKRKGSDISDEKTKGSIQYITCNTNKMGF